MSETEPQVYGLPAEVVRHIDRVCDCFESAWTTWRAARRPAIEDFLGTLTGPERSTLLRELILLDVHYRQSVGEAWRSEEYRDRFGEFHTAWLTDVEPSPVAATLRTRASSGADTVAATQPAGPSFGDFVDLQEIGRGGMGVVYRARRRHPNRIVALKMLGPCGGPDERRRLRAEADHAALLDHPNIVPVYEAGEAEGRAYFTMKWVEGGSLANAVTRGEWSAGDREQQRRAARLVADVARAVHHAHQHGILHRDLKPANILLDADSRPMVADFGLSRRVNAPLSGWSTGDVIGTPGYLAPEQAVDGRGVTTAADVYGLGAILYELLTGRAPFRGASPLEAVLQALHQEPERPSRCNRRVSGDLETICLKCLEREPGRRYASAEAVAEDLERWLAGEPIQARRCGPLERTLKWTRRRPRTATLAVLGVVLIVAGALWQWRSAVAERRAEQARREAARVRDAELLTRTLRESQNLYSEEVVDRLAPLRVPVSHDYAFQDGAIPLPPTLTLALARRVSQPDGGTVRLYSDYPFPTQHDRPEPDDFEREALRQLRRNPGQPYYRFEEWQGRRSLRYATADVMKARCVDCHNTHRDSPKRDWKEGDVRGVVEVILPLD
jgi:serine/threonine-protein kinase